MALTLNLKDSLICFEQLTQSTKSAADTYWSEQGNLQQSMKQMDYFTKTIAFRGEVSFEYVVEKPN